MIKEKVIDCRKNSLVIYEGQMGREIFYVNQGIAAIPPSAFYSKNRKIAEKFVRFCFIKVSVVDV